MVRYIVIALFAAASVALADDPVQPHIFDDLNQNGQTDKVEMVASSSSSEGEAAPEVSVTHLSDEEAPVQPPELLAPEP